MRQKREPVTVRREAKVQNEQGLHARPAAEFARTANIFRSEIWLIKDGTRYEAASLIDIMRANAACGTTITLEAHGTDAEEAVDRLTRLLADFKDED